MIVDIVKRVNLKVFRLLLDDVETNLTSRAIFDMIVDGFQQVHKEKRHKYSYGEIDFKFNMLSLYFDPSETKIMTLAQKFSQPDNECLFFNQETLNINFELNSSSVTLFFWGCL